MTYIRKYDYIDSNLATLYSIVVWFKEYRTKKKELIYQSSWFRVYQYTYISQKERDQMFNDLIQNGMSNAFNCILVQLDPPNFTDVQIKTFWA